MSRTWRRFAVGVVLVGGSLFAGPCGITTLQLQDFVTSTLIRTTVTSVASVVEAAFIEARQQPDVAEP